MDDSIKREAFISHAVKDPMHVQKQSAREPGEPVFACSEN